MRVLLDNLEDLVEVNLHAHDEECEADTDTEHNVGKDVLLNLNMVKMMNKMDMMTGKICPTFLLPTMTSICWVVVRPRCTMSQSTMWMPMRLDWSWKWTLVSPRGTITGHTDNFGWSRGSSLGR